MGAKEALLRSDALLGAIYESAINPASWSVLHQQMLKNFRADSPVSSEQRTFLNYVLKHVQRALKIADAQRSLQWEREQLGRFIDAVAPAICIVRDDGTVVGLNGAAHGLLADAGEGVVLGDRLAPEGRQELKQALATARSAGHAFAQLRLAPAADPLCLHVAPLLSPGLELFSLVIFKNGEALLSALEDFASHFQLTAQEQNVVRHALQQPRLQGAAEAAGVGYHTARQHLKAVYAKTGTASQAELVAGLLRHTVVQQAARTHDGSLLPHVRGLAQSRFVQLGTPRHPRQLCYAEYGDPEGLPLLYFHAINGSRLELLVHDRTLRDRGVRLVAVDRPGFGHSDYHEYESYAEYTRDIRRLLDVLDLTEVSVLSCSAGTPFALACAAYLPGRVRRVHCAGAVPPPDYVSASSSRTQLDRIQARMFRVAPQLLRPTLELMLSGQTVDSLYRSMLDGKATVFRYSPLDIEYISHPEHFDYVVAYTVESLRQGTSAWAKEAAMINQQWSIPFARIVCPVRFWHGDSDTQFPQEMVLPLVQEFAQGELSVIPAETHLLIFRHLPRILDSF